MVVQLVFSMYMVLGLILSTIKKEEKGGGGEDGEEKEEEGLHSLIRHILALSVKV